MTTVPFYKSWIMMGPPSLPSQIDCYDIVLDRAEVVLNDDELGACEGVVRLHLNDKLPSVRALSFRFVAGAVAKMDDPELCCNLRGPERLFDRTIKLWDSTDPDAPPYLDAQQHEFRFALKIPGHMPPSLRFPRGQVQYMLVAAIEWESTCCGIPAPFWSWKPITAKKEVPVRKIPGKIDSTIRKLLSDIPEADEKEVRFMDPADEPEGGLTRRSPIARRLRTGRTIWSPIPEIDISLPSMFPISDALIPVTIDATAEAEIVEFQWSLRQHASYNYMYNITLRGPVDSPHNAIAPKKWEDNHVLRKSYTYRPEAADLLDPIPSTHHSLRIPLADDPLPPNVTVCEDMDTSVMKFRHYAKVQLTYRLAGDGGSLDYRESEIELPVVLFVPPSSEQIDGQIMEGGIGSGQSLMSLYSEEPPAYRDEGYVPVAVEGPRRRRA